MQTLEFDTNLQLGIDLIDKQHAQFFDIMNRMFAAQSSGENRELVDGVIDELAEYVSYHFRCEEELMERFDYPELAEHQRQHIRFAAMVVEIHRKFSRGEIGLETEILSYLVDWFIGHIRHEDRKYLALFREHGLSD